jgi:hypothetical protein
VDYQGQQIFIVHPDAELREKLVRYLRHREYETFGLNSTGNSEIDQRRDSIFFLWTRNDEGWNWRKFADGVKDNGNGHVLVALGSADIPKGFKATLDGNPEDLRTSVEGFPGSDRGEGSSSLCSLRESLCVDCNLRVST